MTKSLSEICTEILNIQEQITTAEKDYKNQIATLKNNLAKAEAQKNLFKHNIDVEKFEHGSSLLCITFPYSGNGTSRRYSSVYKELVDEAIDDLAVGAGYLKEYYIGQKLYSGYDQRDDHRYGYGPTHGTTYQSIGLRNPEKELSAYDLDCCIYLLLNIDTLLENYNNKLRAKENS